MGNKAGNMCIILGTVLILGALSLFVHNQMEATAAEEVTAEILPEVVEVIEERKQETIQQGEPQPEQVEIPPELLAPEELEMDEIVVDGHAYIGFLTIPALNLELPVMADWDDTRLRIAPCRYAGSLKGEDLVIMAHNYRNHFGKLNALREGDEVLFSDVNGVVTRYRVEAKDLLEPGMVEEMTEGVFDLTLFTCTYSRQHRVTVYCEMY